MQPWRLAFLVLLLAVVAGRAMAADDVIYAVPNGDWRLLVQRFEPQAITGPDGRPVPGPVMGLREALARAYPGVTIQLLPGVYTPDSVTGGILFPRDGMPDFPITVRGRLDEKELSFNLGSGGPPIKVSTHNGGIRLRRM